MKYNLLSDILIDRANQKPNMVAYSEVKPDLSIRKSVTNAELLERSTAIAQKITSTIRNTEASVYIFSSSRLEFIELFWGTQLAGQTGIPVNLPNFIFYQKQQKRIINTFKKVNAEYGIYHEFDQDLFTEFQEKNPEILNIQWIKITEDLKLETKSDLPKISPQKTAIIQFTSGSSGNPKGVPLNHQQILTNLHDIVHHRSPDCFAKMVFWLPHNHDMGLFGGFMTAFYHGGETLFIKTQDYLKNPLLWFMTISKYQGTCTPAPNFAFETMAKLSNKIDKSLNLTSLKLIFNGAEFINSNTLLKFIDIYKKYGLKEQVLCNSYGLAESTLMMTGGTFDRNKSICRISKKSLKSGEIKIIQQDSEDTMSVVSCGVTVKNNEIKLSEEPIGKVLISGGSVAHNYFGKEDSDRFQTIADKGTTKLFFNTNDLGFVFNNELYILGRADDVIVHNGEKLYNSDFSVSISAVSDSIVASSVFVYKSEGIIKIAVETTTLEARDFLLKKIQEKIFSEYLISAEVLIFKNGYLPRTTSGKIIRKEAIIKLEAESK